MHNQVDNLVHPVPEAALVHRGSLVLEAALVHRAAWVPVHQAAWEVDLEAENITEANTRVAVVIPAVELAAARAAQLHPVHPGKFISR
ncbi:MAG: hypothetical protein JO028_06775 [Acidobacteriaceae bacterium]|nr:hypothetical protein [Acidobacteriaceae bacterium]